MSEALQKYRQHLVETTQKVSESYDKTIITLSGGALGVSFTFIKDYLGHSQVISPEILFGGWFFLTASLASVLFSLFFGTLAFRKAIRQVDDGTIYENRPGGGLGKLTIYLHSSGAIFLLIGLLLIGSFVYKNIGIHSNDRKTETSTSSITPTTTSTNPSKDATGENTDRSTAASSGTKPSGRSAFSSAAATKP